MPKIKVLREIKDFIIIHDGKKFMKTCFPGDIVEVDKIYKDDIEMGMYKEITPKIITSDVPVEKPKIDVINAINGLQTAIQQATKALEVLQKGTTTTQIIPENNEVIEENQEEIIYSQQDLVAKSMSVQNALQNTMNTDNEHRIVARSTPVPHLYKYSNANGYRYENIGERQKADDEIPLELNTEEKDILDQTPVINLVEEEIHGKKTVNIFKSLGAKVVNYSGDA